MSANVNLMDRWTMRGGGGDGCGDGVGIADG
jgi:hypothetical protein